MLLGDITSGRAEHNYQQPQNVALLLSQSEC